jgi:hypothetical protein
VAWWDAAVEGQSFILAVRCTRNVAKQVIAPMVPDPDSWDETEHASTMFVIADAYGASSLWKIDEMSIPTETPRTFNESS